jgi:hypothetical protein
LIKVINEKSHAEQAEEEVAPNPGIRYENESFWLRPRNRKDRGAVFRHFR